MARAKLANAMLRWLRAEQPASSPAERILVWSGYLIFAVFAVLFFVTAVVMVIGIAVPDYAGASSRWSALGYLIVAAGGLVYVVWRLRKHVRLHGQARAATHKGGRRREGN
jgi:hypothetical protein